MIHRSEHVDNFTVIDNEIIRSSEFRTTAPTLATARATILQNSKKHGGNYE